MNKVKKKKRNLLKKPFFEEVSNKELAQQIISKKKSKTKLPTWYKTPKIYFLYTLIQVRQQLLCTSKINMCQTNLWQFFTHTNLPSDKFEISL
eukprot:TRINITY_DN2288_c0_g1_i1.p2 TRINITY_DN2288_c0_g1~~TRINITY_DN2288_c0_g1_i1.p2  ORF type:complete len:105 (+),score=8.94 TRINITY_DN2288_c0_g1_i1:38-316(+)